MVEIEDEHVFCQRKLLRARSRTPSSLFHRSRASYNYTTHYATQFLSKRKFNRLQVFLCQKYGYRPIPSEILCTDLEMLKKTLREENDVRFLGWVLSKKPSQEFIVLKSRNFPIVSIITLLVNYRGENWTFWYRKFQACTVVTEEVPAKVHKFSQKLFIRL